MFKDIDDYYSMKISTRRQLVDWFKHTATVISILKAEENYNEDDIIKTLRSIITKKNLKHFYSTN